MFTGSKIDPQFRPIIQREKPSAQKMGTVVMQSASTQANMKDPLRSKNSLLKIFKFSFIYFGELQ